MASEKEKLEEEIKEEIKEGLRNLSLSDKVLETLEVLKTTLPLEDANQTEAATEPIYDKKQYTKRKRN